MPRNKILLAIICLSVLTLLGCDKLNFFKPKKESGTVVKGTVIAKIANMPITLEMLNREIDAYNTSIDLSNLTNDEKKKAKIDNREKKLDYLKNSLIRRMVFYQAALDRGLDRRDDISEILERNRATILAQAMEEELTKNINVTASEVDEAYKNVKDQLKEPDTRKVREIMMKTESEAKQALLEILQGADFATLARERSAADSAKAGGDLGNIKKGQRGEKFITFDDVVFSPALQVGSVSSVFKGPDGFYIVKIEGIREGKQSTLSEVQDRLKELLSLRKSQEELDKFYAQVSRDNIKVEIYESEIK
ncbi:MAG: peptidylprolyl isomerase [Candidatus Omnitrophica bacterium]|jgi:parvulin-like peptidyl-prolyl isomerase|nr:peptidylprolyl isomerase [Candidatus Omnitrophota bacterium]